MILDSFDINEFINGSDDYMSEILGDYFTNDGLPIPNGKVWVKMFGEVCKVELGSV